MKFAKTLIQATRIETRGHHFEPETPNVLLVTHLMKVRLLRNGVKMPTIALLMAKEESSHALVGHLEVFLMLFVYEMFQAKGNKSSKMPLDRLCTSGQTNANVALTVLLIGLMYELHIFIAQL